MGILLNHEHMVDLETLGTHSSSPIVSIGMVKFTQQRGIIDQLYIEIDLNSAIEHSTGIRTDTLQWWMQQSDEARKLFFPQRGGQQMAWALQEVTKFMDPNGTLWGNGSDFDNPMLSDKFDRLGMKQPWKFWNNRCYRTLKSQHLDIPLERKGTHHNALDDAITQTEHLLKIREMKGVAAG